MDFKESSRLLQELVSAKANNKKLLAILIDPDKVELSDLSKVIEKIELSPATHILVGGSRVETNILDDLVRFLKNNSGLPVILFPGNTAQISAEADAILFLSLISGRNPDFLIGHQVAAVPILKKTNLEVISTGYILIESGAVTAVESVSRTKPLDRTNPEFALQTAEAGILLGMKLIYLEAGSGAQKAVPLEMISKVSKNVSVPLIVGGGIKSIEAIKQAHDAGADMVVIGNAFEKNLNFFS